MMISTVAYLFIQSINFSVSAQVLYELKDLEVLEREKNFEEFLLHVNDIRPSERGKHWREMFQTMAMGLVDYKIKTRDLSLASYHQIEKIGRSSAMNNDEFFQLKRSIFAKKYFTECFKKISLIENINKRDAEKNLCESELTSFWYFSKKDPDMGLELAAILENAQATIKVWPFYAPAVQDNIANFYCKKPEIQAAIMKKLYEESFSPEFNGNYKSLVERVAPDLCFNELVPPLKESLTSVKSNGLNKEMALNILEAKKKLTKDEEDFYAILFLLDGPVVGDKMNLAWKNVESLAENYQKRQKLLEQIKSLELIPDKIFKDPNLPRHKAIINLFANNFPEYLDYYGSTCIKYISHNSDSPLNVTSSYQCNEFLKAAQAAIKGELGAAKPWISDSVQRQYSALKK
ncbi:MAG: hypothetical protein WC635_00120 [Bacteriovorax sp.]|jgi:hypothetical protein